MSSKRVVIKDVAVEAGISVTSVSFVLNGKGKEMGISDETIAKVKEIAMRLGYAANISAINLRTGSTKTIAVIIPDLSDYFFSLVLRGIEVVASQNQYQVIIHQTFNSLETEKKIFNYLANKTCDGVLYSPAIENKDITKHVSLLNKIVPVVFYDRILNGIDLPRIVSDDFEVSYKAGKYLVEKGCKRILFIGIDEAVSNFKLRFEGFRNAIEEFGSADIFLDVLMCENEDDINKDLKNKLKKNIVYDAVFSCYEKYTMQFLDIISQEEKEIFSKIPIISFYSGTLKVKFLNPNIKIIQQQPFDMGISACNVLLNKIAKKKTVGLMENIVFPCATDF